LIALTWAYLSFGHLDSVAGILYGIKPAVVAIVLFAAYRIGMKTLRHGLLIAIALAAFVGLFVFHISFPYIIIAAAVIGWVGHHFVPDAFKASGGHGASGEQHDKALIDDDTPPPSWAAFSWASSLFKLAVGLLLWLLVEGALYLSFGWQGPLTQMGWFFTKAALVTFGGAYAVLPYVYQGGVNEYQWLSATQMMDGLALGETTPGPLIMIVSFIGFVGGWTKELEPMRPFRGLSSSRPSRSSASAVPWRPSQGFPTSRSTTDRPSGVLGSPAAPSSFPRPRGIPPSGPPGPEGPEPLPQAWAPSQGACREGPLGPKASGSPPGVLRPFSDATDKVRFTRVCLTRHVPPTGFYTPSTGCSLASPWSRRTTAAHGVRTSPCFAGLACRHAWHPGVFVVQRGLEL